MRKLIVLKYLNNKRENNEERRSVYNVLKLDEKIVPKIIDSQRKAKFLGPI